MDPFNKGTEFPLTNAVKVAEVWRKLNKEEIQALYSSANTIPVITPTIRHSLRR